MVVIELPELELEVLNLCLFEERFDVICSECNASKNPNIIADAIKNLLHYKLLVAVNNEHGKLNWMYDVDRMRASSFRVTAKGTDYLT